MIRYILCPACAERFDLHAKDVSDGWTMHKVTIKARLPANNQIEIPSGNETTIIPVPILRCDLGNEEIPEGSEAVAVTILRNGEETGEWWQEFSQP